MEAEPRRLENRGRVVKLLGDVDGGGVLVRPGYSLGDVALALEERVDRGAERQVSPEDVHGPAGGQDPLDLGLDPRVEARALGRSWGDERIALDRSELRPGALGHTLGGRRH